jgi:gamma-glutamyltranspeptidase/glutathione hydrolase
VAGLAEAHRRWGSLPWADLVAPAIRLAEGGVPLTRRSVAYMARVHPRTGLDTNDRLAADPAARAIFTLDGDPLPEGHLLIQKDLAATLGRIARKGERGFYEGPVARALVASVAMAGGVMTLADLADYRPVSREPLVGSYRGHRIVSFPPPSSGGVALLQILGMLEDRDLAGSGFGSSLTIHRMTEAMRRAYADRARWLGDPDHFEVPAAELLDGNYLASRSAGIRDDRATPSAEIAPWSPPPAEPPSTLHFSVADPAGNTVSMTTTLNSSFGSAIVAEGTGVLLNNEIDDFALAPGVPNQFGLVGGEANAIRGGKRPLSSMTPTIVEAPGGGGRPMLVVGSPGGGTIITSVLQVIVNVLDHSMPLQEAVDAPRFHHQWLPDVLRYETRGMSRDVVDALEARGHTLQERSLPLGMIAAIGLDEDGAWLGAADPRGEGTAAGF